MTSNYIYKMALVFTLSKGFTEGRLTFSLSLVPRCPRVPSKCCSNSVAIRKAFPSGLASQTDELCLSGLKPGGFCCQKVGEKRAWGPVVHH